MCFPFVFLLLYLNRPTKIMTKQLLLTLAICVAAISSSFSATVTWDGGGDGINWTDPLNWDTDALPTAADDVDFDGNDVTLTANTTVQRVFVDGSAIFTVDAGVTLTVSGFSGNDEGVEIQGSATLINNGTIAISNIVGGDDADGFYNKGTTTNNGTITIDGAGQHGLYVVAGVFTNTATGIITITNSGVVEGDGDDLYVDDANSGTLFGMLVNDGMITINTTSGDDGINVNDNATLNNNNIIIINGGSSDGVRTQDGGIFNNNANGVLTINMSGDEAIQNDSPSTFNNAGTLDINAPGDHSMEVKATFINSGTLTIDDTVDDGLNITNSGSFTNTVDGVITITNPAKNAIQVDANSNATPAMIDNAGMITITGAGDHAVRAQETGVITNSGTLSILNSEKKAMQVEVDAVLNNSGTIDISVTGTASSDGEGLDLRDGTFNNLTGGVYRAKDCSDDGLELNGIFNNDGTIEIDGSGSEDIEVFSSATVNNTANAIFKVGCPGIGDLEIKGNFDFGMTTIEIDISGLAGTTEFDQVLNFSSGNFVTLLNATLDLNWGTYIPSVGDKFKVVDGSGLTIGSFASVTSSNPQIVYIVNNLGTEIEIEVTEILPYSLAEFGIDDPCACLDNATILDADAGTGGDDGQFSEIVTITGLAGDPLPEGQSWVVVGATGVLDAFDVPAVGTQSAGVPVAADGSVALINNAGVYEIPFVHVDGVGYSIMIEGPFAMGSPANTTLEIGNLCQYPNPVFDPEIPATLNQMAAAITLGAMDSNGGAEETVTYTIDGTPAMMIDPATLALGTHTVVMTYDGLDDGNGGVSPDGGTTPASPGCIQEVTKDFEIIECELIVDCSNVVDETLACRADLPLVDNDLIVVTDSCGDVTITALTIIPGNTGCPEDTLTITRTYTINDGVSPAVECMQTFTIVSSMDPTFTFFPADTAVLCGAATDPAATGMAEGAGECDPTSPQATVTFTDLVTPEL